jgi:hypothetical protein
MLSFKPRPPVIHQTPSIRRTVYSPNKMLYSPPPSAPPMSGATQEHPQLPQGPAAGEDRRAGAAGPRVSREVIAETTRHGVVRYQLEARLAFCEIEAKSDPATARAYAKTLGEDARSKGFGLIATQGARPGGLIPRQFPRILVL